MEAEEPLLLKLIPWQKVLLQQLIICKIVKNFFHLCNQKDLLCGLVLRVLGY
jgi:hypothetical protein